MASGEEYEPWLDEFPNFGAADGPPAETTTLPDAGEAKPPPTLEEALAAKRQKLGEGTTPSTPEELQPGGTVEITHITFVEGFSGKEATTPLKSGDHTIRAAQLLFAKAATQLWPKRGKFAEFLEKRELGIDWQMPASLVWLLPELDDDDGGDVEILRPSLALSEVAARAPGAVERIMWADPNGVDGHFGAALRLRVVLPTMQAVLPKLYARWRELTPESEQKTSFEKDQEPAKKIRTEEDRAKAEERFWDEALGRNLLNVELLGRNGMGYWDLIGVVVGGGGGGRDSDPDDDFSDFSDGREWWEVEQGGRFDGADSFILDWEVIRQVGRTFVAETGLQDYRMNATG